MTCCTNYTACKLARCYTKFQARIEYVPYNGLKDNGCSHHVTHCADCTRCKASKTDSLCGWNCRTRARDNHRRCGKQQDLLSAHYPNQQRGLKRDGVSCDAPLNYQPQRRQAPDAAGALGQLQRVTALIPTQCLSAKLSDVKIQE